MASCSRRGIIRLEFGSQTSSWSDPDDEGLCFVDPGGDTFDESRFAGGDCGCCAGDDLWRGRSWRLSAGEGQSLSTSAALGRGLTGGDATLTLAGYEKFIDELLLLGRRSPWASVSDAAGRSDVRTFETSPTAAAPNQDPCPSLSFCDATRNGAPRLFALRCWAAATSFGRPGTGGASWMLNDCE